MQSKNADHQFSLGSLFDHFMAFCGQPVLQVGHNARKTLYECINVKKQRQLHVRCEKLFILSTRPNLIILAHFNSSFYSLLIALGSHSFVAVKNSINFFTTFFHLTLNTQRPTSRKLTKEHRSQSGYSFSQLHFKHCIFALSDTKVFQHVPLHI